ncbi:hypothetical protein BDZ90DRAFT_122903 [Jaminaea rosea]|uniref:Uncharacterized protein n=1 Tax=Jaminaea rosea TaxID=1569628 RepID=A0A316UGJ8_9BASI|nr:hypothetical protein BDZ90DRAFT_122903 [Jaminaea rosea]PWN24386.1 hypothetical protein BDZ90DRAFT_122903 [Jaminaea rosea]
MGQPATAGIIVACIFVELPPIRQPLGSTYGTNAGSYGFAGAGAGSLAASPGTPEYGSTWRAGSASKSSFAMERPGSIYGGALSSHFDGKEGSSSYGRHSRAQSLAGLSSPLSPGGGGGGGGSSQDASPHTTSPYGYPGEQGSLAELGVVAMPQRVASPDAVSDAGGPSARPRTMSSSSSTMTLRRSYAGSTDYLNSSARRNSQLFGSSGSSTYGGGGGGAGPSKRDSYLPHLPSNRDAIQIVPPQPLGIGLGGMATAKDQRTLAFSKQSGIGLGEEAFGEGNYSWNEAAAAAAQQEGGQQPQRSLSPGSVSGSIGAHQLHRYLQEGPLGRAAGVERRGSPSASDVGAGSAAGSIMNRPRTTSHAGGASINSSSGFAPPLRQGTPHSNYNSTTANSSPILGAFGSSSAAAYPPQPPSKEQQQQQQQPSTQHHATASRDEVASRSGSGSAGSPSAAASASGSGSGSGSRSGGSQSTNEHHRTHESMSSSTTKTSQHEEWAPSGGGVPPVEKVGAKEGLESNDEPLGINAPSTEAIQHMALNALMLPPVNKAYPDSPRLTSHTPSFVPNTSSLPALPSNSLIVDNTTLFAPHLASAVAGQLLRFPVSPALHLSPPTSLPYVRAYRISNGQLALPLSSPLRSVKRVAWSVVRAR